MKKLLTWMDKCDSIPTTEIAKLAEKRGNLEMNMANILEIIKTQNDKLARIADLRNRESNFGNMVQWTKDFETMSKSTIWQKIPDTTQAHHTTCSYSGCHTNCHMHCQLPETPDCAVIGIGCLAFNDGTSVAINCRQCGHTADHHHHWRATWEQKVEENVDINEDRKREHLQASYNLRTTEGQRQALEREQANSRDTLNKAVDRLGQLCHEFNGIAISGSFSGFISSRINALEEEQETMKMNGSNPEALDGMKRSIELLISQLGVIQMAEAARKKKSSYGGGSKYRT